MSGRTGLHRASRISQARRRQLRTLGALLLAASLVGAVWCLRQLLGLIHGADPGAAVVLRLLRQRDPTLADVAEMTSLRFPSSTRLRGARHYVWLGDSLSAELEMDRADVEEFISSSTRPRESPWGEPAAGNRRRSGLQRCDVSRASNGVCIRIDRTDRWPYRSEALFLRVYTRGRSRAALNLEWDAE